MPVDNDDVRTVQTGVAVVADIIKAAGDNPKVKEAGDNLGQTALTITKTVNNVLLPLAAVNYGIDKARIYFKDRFPKELEEKTKDIKIEDIVEPKASIAGPALQGLAFTHEEESLKDMYLSLLATSMNGKTAAEAHPAFVEIIRQLTSEEAHLLKGLLNSNNAQPICEVRLKNKDNTHWSVLLKHLINISNMSTGDPVENERYPSMIENWIRLGLVAVDYMSELVAEKVYDWAETRPEVEKLREKNQEEEREIFIQKGILKVTPFGEQFAKAVDI